MSLLHAAKRISEFTYQEMMEMADWLSGVTVLDDDGEEFDGPVVSRERMAACLSDWSNEVISENEN